MLLIGGAAGAGVDVDGMGWWSAGGLFEAGKPNAASTTASPAAAHAVAMARQYEKCREESGIGKVLPLGHRAQYMP